MRFALVILAATVSATASAAEPMLSVGFADVDVSPDLSKKPVYLAGFGTNRLATKVHDPIMVRAVVLGDATDKIALVSADVVGLFLPTVERVRKKLPGFRTVVVSATHNHEGPDTLGLWGKSPFESGLDAEYLKRLEGEIVAAVQKADAARKPATAKLGTAKGPELLVDNRLPEVKLDELVAIHFADPETRKPLGIVVQWNCHPETLDSKNTQVSADFVAATVRHLAAKHRCPVAYFTGAVGGLMTSLEVPVKDESGKLLQDGTFAKTERYGILVGELADRALAAAKPVKLVPFAVKTREILVPVDNGLYRLAWQFGVLNRPIYKWNGTAAPKEFTETRDIAKPCAVRSEVGYVALGDLEIAVIPGEIYPELVLGKVQDPVDPGADFPDAKPEPAIYRNLRGKNRMILGLANDELGYFIPKRQWDEKKPYCYGRKKPQYGEVNSTGPDAARVICETFRDLVGGK